MFMAEEEATVSSCCHRLTLAYIQYLRKGLDVLIRKVVVHVLAGVKMIAEYQALT